MQTELTKRILSDIQRGDAGDAPCLYLTGEDGKIDRVITEGFSEGEGDKGFFCRVTIPALVSHFKAKEVTLVFACILRAYDKEDHTVEEPKDVFMVNHHAVGKSEYFTTYLENGVAKDLETIGNDAVDRFWPFAQAALAAIPFPKFEMEYSLESLDGSWYLDRASVKAELVDWTRFDWAQESVLSYLKKAKEFSLEQETRAQVLRRRIGGSHED